MSTASQLQSTVTTVNGIGGNATIILNDGTYQLTDTLYINVPNVTIRSASGNRSNVIIQGDAMSKPRHNFVYSSGEFSRPYRIGITLQI